MARVTPLALLSALTLTGCIFHVEADGPRWDGLRFSDDAAAGPRIRGDGIAAAETRDLDLTGVVRVELRGGVDAAVRAGSGPSLEVSGDRNILARLRTEVRGEVLGVWLEAGSYELEHPLLLDLELPTLSRLVISGSSDADVQGLDGERLVVDVPGSGDVRLAGALDALDVRIQGSGDVDARELALRSAAVDVQGSGDIQLGDLDELRVKITGSGDVSYSGHPATRDVEVRGSGSVLVR